MSEELNNDEKYNELLNIINDIKSLEEDNRKLEFERVVNCRYITNHQLYDYFVYYILMFGSTTILSKAFTQNDISFLIASGVFAAADIGAVSLYKRFIDSANNELSEKIEYLIKEYMHNCKNIKLLTNRKNEILNSYTENENKNDSIVNEDKKRVRKL